MTRKIIAKDKKKGGGSHHLNRLNEWKLWSQVSHRLYQSEFDSNNFKKVITSLGVQISRSALGCPWENGYQESFYSQFKVDIGDWSRYQSVGELISAVYQIIWNYNNTRIHSALKMPPEQFFKMQ